MEEQRQASVAVLIPCYNEAVTIGKVVTDFRAALPHAEVYVYDNNSTDKTASVAREAGAIVRRETRQGKGNAVRQMFRDIDADYYILVDGDDTYPAESAHALLEPLEHGLADMTVGDRLSNKSYEVENKRSFHTFGNNLVRWLIKVMYHYDFSDVMTGYRGFTRAFVKTFPVTSSGFQLETEMSIHAVDNRWRIVNVPIVYRDRPAGSYSKLSTFDDGIKVISTIASLFKDYRPMAFFSIIALLLFLLGLAAGIPVIAEYFATHYVSKVPSAILAVGLVFSGLLSYSVGLVLDTVAKNHRKSWELQAMRYFGHRQRADQER
ncbi:MAG: glycosyltransferase family 2 protein [Actinomycetaceae bacterium]|nr:glycosyltransferase family 2 protein [Actinomycetaceae bacterium]MDY6082323.1 glycosyltransferase family 2 protein [Actinomycetaceae bacterium]